MSGCPPDCALHEAVGCSAVIAESSGRTTRPQSKPDSHPSVGSPSPPPGIAAAPRAATARSASGGSCGPGRMGCGSRGGSALASSRSIVSRNRPASSGTTTLERIMCSPRNGPERPHVTPRVQGRWPKQDCANSVERASPAMDEHPAPVVVMVNDGCRREPVLSSDRLSAPLDDSHTDQDRRTKPATWPGPDRDRRPPLLRTFLLTDCSLTRLSTLERIAQEQGLSLSDLAQVWFANFGKPAGCSRWSPAGAPSTGCSARSVTVIGTGAVVRQTGMSGEARRRPSGLSGLARTALYVRRPRCHPLKVAQRRAGELCPCGARPSPAASPGSDTHQGASDHRE
jgi:hypothetical protein